MAFDTKITKARFTVPGYQPEQMKEISQELIEAGIRARIMRGQNTYDGAATPLKRGYARMKQRRGKQALRDWVFTGRTLRSLQVLSATHNKSIIGFTDAVSNKRAAINNARERQFGISPSDQAVLNQAKAKAGSPVKAERV